MMDVEQMENFRKTLMAMTFGRESQPSLLYNITRNLRQKDAESPGPQATERRWRCPGQGKGSQSPALIPNVRTDLWGV